MRTLDVCETRLHKVIARGIVLVLALCAVMSDAIADTRLSGESAVVEADTVTITDATGRQVRVGLPVKRIAFHHFQTAEAIQILNAWDRVVARGRDLDAALFRGLADIPVISAQGVYDIDVERVLALEADVLLSIDLPMAGADELIARLSPHVPVVSLNFRDPETFDDNLHKLALLLGKQHEAQTYLTWYHAVVAQLQAKAATVPEAQKPRVFVKTSWGEPSDIQSFSDLSPGIAERNALTASVNAAQDLPSQGGWVQAVDPEWLIAQDIDAMVIMDVVHQGYGFGVTDRTPLERHRQAVMALPAFSLWPAVQRDQVYMISGELFATPRFIIGFAYMAKWFHPERYRDLSPEALHGEYLQRFMRVPADVQKQGVFVHPDRP